MGYRIAESASKRRHAVTLISGPTRLKQPRVKKFIPIERASDLLRALKKEIENADCLIMCAAVSDFRARHVIKKKIKRGKALSLELVSNKDILSELTRYKKDKVFVGFSLETEDLIKRSFLKLKNKHLDLIVANRLSSARNPFGDNKLDAYIINKSGDYTQIKGKNKAFIARVLLDKIEKLWYLRYTDACRIRGR